MSPKVSLWQSWVAYYDLPKKEKRGSDQEIGRGERARRNREREDRRKAEGQGKEEEKSDLS